MRTGRTSSASTKLPWLGRLTLILGAVLLGGAIWPRLVLAHAGLVRSEPADLCLSPLSTSLPSTASCDTDSLLSTPPSAIHLWFSEPVQAVRHGIIVIAPSGQRVEQGAIQSDGLELSVAVTATEQGSYVVYWQAISGDTHPVRGQFVFSLGYASAVASVALARSSELGAVSPFGLALQVASRWLHFGGYALGFGPFVFWGLLRRDPAFKSERAEARIWRLVNFGIVMLVLAEPLALLGQTGSLSADQLFDPDLLGDILASSFGRVLAQRLGAAAALWLLLGVARHGSSKIIAALLGLGLALALVDGQASHAVSSGPLLPGLVANTLHLMAMGVWLGGLATLLALWNVPELAAQRGELARQFGRLALVSLAWLVASGLLMAWLHLAQPTDLFTSAYGLTLTTKLLLVLIVLLLALAARLVALNRRVRWWNWEAAALLLVLALAGLLVSLPPPA